MNISKKTALALSGGVIVLGSGLGVAAIAQAETTSPTPSPSITASSDKPDLDHRGRPGGRLGEDVAQLATKLGLSEDTVRAAIQKVRNGTRPTIQPTATDTVREALRKAYITALAKELNIDEAKLTAALDELRATRIADAKAALKTRLDQAVKDGKLTQAEADAVAKAAEAGVIGYGRLHR